MSLQVVLSIFFILKNDNKSQDNFWCDILARNACHIVRKAMAVWLKGHLPNREEKYFYILEEDKVKFVLGAFEGENCCEVTLLGNISFFYVRQMEEVQLFKKLERFMHWFERRMVMTYAYSKLNYRW